MLTVQKLIEILQAMNPNDTVMVDNFTSKPLIAKNVIVENSLFLNRHVIITSRA